MMRRGAWHQCGDKSQRMVIEELENDVGAGVIVSPRDVPLHKAIEYSAIYRGLGADVIVDPQFYVPGFSNRCLDSYPISRFGTTAARSYQISPQDVSDLAAGIESINRSLGTSAVVAPAVTYEAGRNRAADLNAQLFRAAKSAGDALGIPTYASVVLGRSVVSSDETIEPVLSQATALSCDGWYYGFEFAPERIPSSEDSVLRCCTTGLALACTGLPVLHAFAGPMALLSLGFGATGTGIGHNQNLWRFTPGRWGPPSGQGGGGDAPPRFFSSALWGTIVYQDETARLSQDLRTRVLTQSPFSRPTASRLAWDRWSANKHLIFAISAMVSSIARVSDPRANVQSAMAVLSDAVRLHRDIAAERLVLKDNTDVYQRNWYSALTRLLSARAADYEYLRLLR